MNVICLILTMFCLDTHYGGPTFGAKVSPGTLQLTRCRSCRFHDGQGVIHFGGIKKYKSMVPLMHFPYDSAIIWAVNVMTP